MTDWLATALAHCTQEPRAPPQQPHTQVHKHGLHALLPRKCQGVDKKQHSHIVTVSYGENHELTVRDRHTPTQEPPRDGHQMGLGQCPHSMVQTPKHSHVPTPPRRAGSPEARSQEALGGPNTQYICTVTNTESSTCKL